MVISDKECIKGIQECEMRLEGMIELNEIREKQKWK